MVVVKIYFILLCFYLVKADITRIKNETVCKDKTLIDVNKNTMNEDYCKKNICIISHFKSNCVIVVGPEKRKCVPLKSLLNTYNNNLSHFQDVYKKQYHEKLEKNNKTFEESFKIVSFKNKLYEDNCVDDMILADFVKRSLYFLEDGSILIDTPNDAKRYATIARNNFIILLSAVKENDELKPRIYFRQITKSKVDPDRIFKDRIMAIGMLGSCLFMILVIIVYGILKELQNVFGIVVMGYLATFCLAFLLKAILIFGTEARLIGQTACRYLEPAVSFSMLSGFMWMNVMSYHIWQTFRDTHYRNVINRRRKLLKFLYYAAYAWLIPFIVVAIEIAIDRADLSNFPNFKKPSFDTCAFGFTSKLIYLLIPIFIILLINVMLFGLTWFNMWRVKNELSRFNKSETKNNKTNENRFSLFYRLSLIMGINWFFEILCAIVALPMWLEYIIDSYNVLVGVFIFFIFVFKKRILLHLCKRLNINIGIQLLQRNVDQSTTRRNTSNSSFSQTGDRDETVMMKTMVD